MPDPRELRTARLKGRPPQRGDLDRYLTLLTAPEVTAWLRPAPLRPFTAEEVRHALERDVRRWSNDGFGPWVLDLAGEPVGRAGLASSTVGGDEVVELVWTIAPRLWGRGLATEAAEAAVRLAGALGLPDVVAVTLPENRASRRVMEKAGLTFDGAVVHAGLPHVRYRRTLIRSTPRGAPG